MTNKERYKQAFSVLQTSETFSLEAESMERAKKQHTYRSIVAAAGACVIIVGSTTAAYAANLGGIQRTLQLWFRGDQTEATVRFDGNGGYSMEFVDGDGNVVQRGGGGVALHPGGTETPLLEEDLMAELTAPDVQYEEDGSVYVYWLGQKLEISGKFENDVCYIQLVNGDEILYMTVKYQNGYATSPNKYLDPHSFN